MKFFPLAIQSIQQETSDCITLSLEVPVHWQEAFRYEAGQYLTFRTRLEGEELRRSYSLCSSPLEQQWRVAIKKVTGGKFSTYAHHQLKVGDLLETAPPQGRFGQAIQAGDGQTYVGFAAGSGITPICSILKTILTLQPNSRFILFYGNQNRHSILFKTELEALKNRYLGRLSVHHILSREQTDAAVLNGRIDAEKCRFFLEKFIPPAQVDHYFICGPESMMHEVRQELLNHTVDPKKIHLELFGVKSTANRPASAPQASGLQSKVKIQLDGSTFDIPVAYDGDSILEVALRRGADLPYACKGGVCCTCRAKVLQGSVTMQVNYALEPDEVAAGYVLTCQTHPRSAEVVLDFDAK